MFSHSTIIQMKAKEWKAAEFSQRSYSGGIFFSFLFSVHEFNIKRSAKISSSNCNKKRARKKKWWKAFPFDSILSNERALYGEWVSGKNIYFVSTCNFIIKFNIAMTIKRKKKNERESKKTQMYL